MKKLFALLLSFMLLFLTACNNKPADSTLGTGTGTGTGTTNSPNQSQPSELDVKDTIVFNLNEGFIDLPSRTIYEKSGTMYYYSKVDGKAYVYCYDPLCEHNNGDCMANPDMSFNARYIFFINNRFYYPISSGKIISFSFDGTDKKIEYDGEYNGDLNVWGHSLSVGPYIYIELYSFASEDGIAHTLRFNVETGEMEDLTEKTGNYIRPNFFYNGMLYGYGQGIERVKTNLDLTYCEEIEPIPSSSDHFSGSRFFGIYNSQGHASIRLYDMKTETLETYDIEGWNEGDGIYTLYADENYFYFYKNDKILLGEIWKRGELKPTYKYNDGSIYRVNHDGTGLVCIYEEAEFTITGSEAIIVGDQFLVFGQNVRVRDNQTETWDNGLLVGTIGADGKIDELKPVEVVE